MTKTTPRGLKCANEFLESAKDEDFSPDWRHCAALARRVALRRQLFATSGDAGDGGNASDASDARYGGGAGEHSYTLIMHDYGGLTAHLSKCRALALKRSENIFMPVPGIRNSKSSIYEKKEKKRSWRFIDGA